MAPSLQALIDFLLAEIALCGDQGMKSLVILFIISATLFLYLMSLHAAIA